MGWTPFRMIHGKADTKDVALEHSLVPFLMAIKRFWSMGFLDWSPNSICKGG